MGKVTDPSGAVVAGATVTVTNIGTNVSRTLTTDSSGAYVAAALNPGNYTVSAQAAGFKVVVHQGVVVQVGLDTRADITLQLGANTQRVTVTEAVPLVDTTSATVGGTLTNTQINDLPLNGRNFQNLVALRPGVVIYPGGGPWQQSSNGQRPQNTAYFVDGLMDIDYSFGWTVMNTGTPITDAGSVLPLDAISEFNVEQNPKAEYGWLSGEVINVGIRTGTNGLHGSAYAFGRDGSWDARNFFNPAPQPVPSVSLENWGASLGGPIIKNKLFYFAAFEERRDAIANSFVEFIPETTSQVSTSQPAGDTTNSIPDAEAALTNAGIPISAVSQSLLSLYPANATSSPVQTFGFPNTDLTDNGIAKITYSINEHNTLNGMFFHSEYLGAGEDHPYVNPIFDVQIPMSVWVNTESWTWTPGSAIVNQLTFGMNRLTQTRHADTVPATTYGINTGVTSVGGLPTIGISGFNSLGTSIISPIGDGPDPVYDGLDTVTYIRGNHTFMFGYEMSHISVDSCCQFFNRGDISFGGGGAFSNSTPLEDFLSGNPSFALIGVGNGVRHLRTWYYAGFAQDDWRVTPRLTVNLGLRYEYFSPPTETSNLLGGFSPTTGLIQIGSNGFNTLFKPNRGDFSPRFGLAWDPTGHATTAIRAGAALIYDHPNLETLAGAGSIPTGFTLNGVPGTGTINNSTVFVVPSNSDWNNVVFPNLNITPSCSNFAQCTITFVDPNLRFPYIVDWNFGIQHQFTSSLGLDVTYVGNYGADLWSTIDLNAPVDPLSGNLSGPYAPQFPYLHHINEDVSAPTSHYNALQVQFEQHPSHGLSFLASYTYSHGIDDVAAPSDGLHFALMKGNSDFDVRHRLTLTTTYDLPNRKSPLQLLDGWELNSIVTLQTGLPWGVVSAGALGGVPNQDISETGEFVDPWDFFGNPSDFTSKYVGIPFCSGAFETTDGVTCTEYPLNTPQVTLTPAQSEPFRAACNAVAPAGSQGAGQTLDTVGCYVKGKSVMAPPPFGTIGTMGRNMFRDSGFRNWDLSVFKNWRFGERFTGQFRAEFFNVLNHPEFANPFGVNAGTGLTDPGAPGAFGSAAATPDVAAGNPIVGSGGPRAIQLGFELKF
ncbi:MAG: TonB-dependent receptor domain-containing protein [Candidatus Acidiferrales bacterium]